MTVTLLTLRTRTRRRADQVSSNFISDAELNDYINESVQWVHYEMTCSGLYPEESSTSVTATGASGYALPEMVSIISVERVSGTTFIPLRRAEKAEIPGFRSVGSGVGIMYDVSWSLRAAPSLRLFPNPTSGSYTVRYVPAVTALSADGDTIYASGGWDELIVVAAAIKCIQRENGDTAGLDRQRQELLGRLQREMNHRDWSYPPRITHTAENWANSETAESDYTDRHGSGW